MFQLEVKNPGFTPIFIERSYIRLVGASGLMRVVIIFIYVFADSFVHQILYMKLKKSSNMCSSNRRMTIGVL